MPTKPTNQRIRKFLIVKESVGICRQGGIDLTQTERRLYLINYLLRENTKYHEIKIPHNENEQKDLLRSLFNIRPPEPISEEFLDVQDEYLALEIESRGIVDCATLFPTKYDNRIYLWQGDITTLKVDAIVNAANSALLGCFQPLHSCIDNIIHTLSGIQLRLDCNQLMQAQGHAEETGKAKITSAYNLPCTHVIHTVGPIISGDLTNQDRMLLADCYNSCLKIAAENKVNSIAFCCISTGVFHFPAQAAAKIAVETVSRFLEDNSAIEKIIFNVFTDNDLAIYHSLLKEAR